ncbi:MAG: hypothetical protein HFE95_09335 [Acutalibacter sp.]|nr:hypothetical protein [Acutalibacter sp.]
MNKQNRRIEWQEEWREFYSGWESRLLVVAWAAALLFVIGMALGGLLSHWHAAQGPERQKPVVDVVFTEEQPAGEMPRLL